MSFEEIGYTKCRCSTLTVFKNQGKGNFTKALQTAAPGGTYSIVTGDLNNDGYADLVTSDAKPGSGISVLLNQQNGAFSTVNYTSVTGPNWRWLI